MKLIISALLCLTFMQSYGQANEVTLDSCLRGVRINYPIAKQKQLIDEMEQTSIHEINHNWLPRLNFGARGAFQTETISFQGLSFPNDSYIATLSAEQPIYDGGQTGKTKSVEHLNSEAKRMNTEVEMYGIFDKVSQLYCQTLLLRESTNILRTVEKDLNSKKEQIEKAVQNGILLRSNLEEIEVQILSTQQSIIEANGNLEGNYKALTLYSGILFSESIKMSTAYSGNFSADMQINRPEMRLFATQKQLLIAQQKLSNATAIPRLSLSAEGNYGRPGPNFFNTDLRFYGQAGIQIRWNVGTLYNLSTQKRNLGLRQKIVDTQMESFEMNTKSKLQIQQEQIIALQEIIKSDDSILEKRHKITKTASSQLENGSITTTEYLTQVNNEMQAALNKKVHEIKLLNSGIQYNITKGTASY